MYFEEKTRAELEAKRRRRAELGAERARRTSAHASVASAAGEGGTAGLGPPGGPPAMAEPAGEGRGRRTVGEMRAAKKRRWNLLRDAVRASNKKRWAP